MADRRHIGNSTLAISPQPFIGSRRNFAEHGDLWRKHWGRLKFAYFKNSRCRTAATLEIENSPISATVHWITTKFCTSIQIWVANNAES